MTIVSIFVAVHKTVRARVEDMWKYGQIIRTTEGLYVWRLCVPYWL